MGLRATQADEKRLLFSSHCPRRHHPSPCHPDRSVAQWRDLRFSELFLGMFFDRAQRSRGTYGLLIPWTVAAAITTLPFVIPTQRPRMRFFLEKNRMMLINATGLDRKSGGA
jgi:hypothetical protein